MIRTALTAAALATSALTATPAAAQEIEGLEIVAGGTLLTVSATGSASREPDLAMFSAGVATTGTTAGEALRANSAAMNRVVRALRDSGVAERDIQTSNLNVSPVYADRMRTSQGTLEEQLPQIIGYRANNEVMVKQRDLDNFGKVIDTLVSAGANQVNGPMFQIERQDEALDEARRMAIAEARKRAELFASATGLKVRRILTISESGGYSRPMAVMARAMSDAAESTPISVGEVEAQAQVSVQFELAP